MTEHDSLLEAVRDLREVGIAGPDLGRARARTREALAAELRGGRRRRWAGPREAAALAAIVAVVVAVVVVALAGEPDRGHGVAGGGPGARGLVARLAVLRRAQTPADRLPAHLNFGGVDLPGSPIPSLTRLLGRRGPVRMYLVVTKPPSGGTPLWSPRLGDQAALLLVKGRQATFRLAFPAAELDDASFVTPLAVTATSGGPRTIAQLVPDDVARVRVRYLTSSGATVARASATVRSNLALWTPVLRRRISRRDAFGVRAQVTWYRADGSVVPTSDRAYRRALAAQQAAEGRQILHEAERSRIRASAALLRAFAVFSVHGAHGVTRDGVTVSAPPLSAVPTSVLGSLVGPPDAVVDRTAAPDVHEIRKVRTPGGHVVWVIPREDSLCVAANTPSGLPGAGGASRFVGNDDCSRSAAAAERAGAGFGSGGTIQVGVLPRAHPTVRFSIHGRVRTLRPPFGVYYLTGARRVG